MKKPLLIILMISMILSCKEHDSFDVVVKTPNGITYKYKCQVGKDTNNSVKYKYYKSLLVSKEFYRNGERNGNSIRYFPNGEIKKITTFKNGKANGIGRIYNKSGLEVQRSLFVADTLILADVFQYDSIHSLIFTACFAHIDNKMEFAGGSYPPKKGYPNNEYEQDHYIKLEIYDTIAINTKAQARIDFFFPHKFHSINLLVGVFNGKLDCIDTIYFANLDSTDSKLIFNFIPDTPYDNFIVAKLDPADKLTPDSYSFDHFYCKP